MGKSTTPKKQKSPSTSNSPVSKKSSALPKEKPTRTQPQREASKKNHTIVRYDPGAPDFLVETKNTTKRTRAPASSRRNLLPMRHRPYLSLIKEAIKKNADRAAHHRNGKPYVSALVIENWIKANYKVTTVFERCFRAALHNAVLHHKLNKIKNSYALKAIKRTSSSSRGRTSTRSASSSPASSASPSPRRAARSAASKKKKPAARVTKKRATSSSDSSDASPSPASRKSTTSRSGRVIKSKSSTSSNNNNNNNSNSSSSEKPTPLKRGESVVAIPSSKYSHFWQYQDHGWKNYDIKASDAVEKVYLDYLKNRGNNDVRAVKSGQWEYQVDFLAMKQTNINHENHTTRNIRRVPNTAAISSENAEKE